MTVKWKKETKPELILKEIEASRTFDNAKGNSSFAGFSLTLNMSVLESLLIFPSDLDDIDSSELIRKSLSSAPNLSKDGFLDQINKILRNELRKPSKNYHILTSISADPRMFPKQFSLLGSIIRFSGLEYPKIYASRKIGIAKHSAIKTKDPQAYCKIIIKTKAKTARGAMFRALRSIDAFRGLYCLQINTQFELFGGKNWEPINKFRLGPIHTLHNSKGRMESEVIWYDPNFFESAVYSKKEKEILLNNVKFFRRRISFSQLSTDIVESLLLCTRALDEKDANTAFLRLWNALEKITSPTANYNETIRRCSFIFSNRAYHEQVIDHLRIYRNRSVHSGTPSDFSKSHCYSLQGYFRHLFWFFVSRTKTANALQDVWKFLDQPSDVESLRQRIKIAQEAVRFFNIPAKETKT